MIIPYSTDAPIYYFPWMTIALIVVNTLTFMLTGMGAHNHGWILTFGRGLHPLEWVAYNFLHFGPGHLIGNMFFLWAFGIVVEGKLGWLKFLGVYLGIGIFGGFVIQAAMLGYIPDDALVQHESNPPAAWLWHDNSLLAQDAPGGKEPEIPDMGDDGLVLPKLDPNAADPAIAVGKDDPAIEADHVGAGGASLIIYGLMAIVLVWAPRNEIHCLWLGFRSGVFEFEYLYFCGFYIVTEILCAVFSSRGFVASSEVGHAVGAISGFALGVLFVKQHWVDCENWDLFSVLSGRHLEAQEVAGWHNYYSVSGPENPGSINELNQNNPDSDAEVKKKKKKAKPKLVELDSIDDPFEIPDEASDEIEPPRRQPEAKTLGKSSVEVAFPAPMPAPPPIPSRRPAAQPGFATACVRQSLFEGDFRGALAEFQQYRAIDAHYRLPQEELRMLANGLFKARAVSESAALLDEYIRRFDADADRQRVKLAVLYVKYLKRPTAALRQLARVNSGSLPQDYRGIYQTAAREAQRMIADGVTDHS